MVQIPSNKLSWSEGLLTLLPLSRGQLIDVPTTQTIKVVVCKIRDPEGAITANNIIPQALLEAGSSPFRVPLLGAKQYQAIAIDIASRSIEFKLNLLTSQKIEGKVLVRITYRVLDPSLVVTRDDVLSELKLETQRVLHNYSEALTHMGIYARDIENEVSRMDVRHLGLYIERVIVPNTVEWDKDLIEEIRGVVKTESASNRNRNEMRVAIEEERIRNDYILSELIRFNITDPEAVLFVLANYDKYKSVMKAVLAFREQARESTREERKEAIELLTKMVNGGVMDGTQLSSLIDFEIERSTRREMKGNNVPVIGSQPQHPQIGSGQQHAQLPPPTRSNQSTYPQYDTQHEVQSAEQRPYVYAGNSMCAPSNAYLVVISPNNIKLQLCAGRTRLGRKTSDNDIIISDEAVSRYHAVIVERGGVFAIHNAKENIVTQVNGVLVPNDDEVRLNDGDEIRIGQAVMQIRIPKTSPQTNKRGGFDDDETRFG